VSSPLPNKTSAPVCIEALVDAEFAFLSTLPFEGGLPLAAVSKSFAVPSPTLSINKSEPFFK